MRSADCRHPSPQSQKFRNDAAVCGRLENWMQRSPWRKALSITACIVAYAAVFEKAKLRRSIFLGCSARKKHRARSFPPSAPLCSDVRLSIGDKKDVEQTLQDASTSIVLRADPPSDGDSLARRAQADFGPLLDALWGLGFYNAHVRFRRGGSPVDPGRGSGAGWCRCRSLSGPCCRSD